MSVLDYEKEITVPSEQSKIDKIAAIRMRGEAELDEAADLSFMRFVTHAVAAARDDRNKPDAAENIAVFQSGVHDARRKKFLDRIAALSIATVRDEPLPIEAIWQPDAKLGMTSPPSSIVKAVAEVGGLALIEEELHQYRTGELVGYSYYAHSNDILPPR